MISRRQIGSQTRAAAVLLRRFGEWWLGELSALVPARLRRRLDARGARLIVALDPPRAILLLENGKAEERLGSVEMAPGRDAAAAVQTLLRERRLAGRIVNGTVETCVRLPEASALRTLINLPLAAEGNLDEVVSFELDRHTPFHADQAYCTARVVARDPATKRLSAEVIVVPRSVADDALSVAAERLGLSADRLDIGPASANLLPAALWPSAVSGGRLVAVLAGAAACLALVAIYLPVARMEHEADRTADEFASVRAAVALQRQIDELKKEQRLLVDRKAKTPTVSKLLLETTHLLPDDTSLASWQQSGNEVQFGGTTRSAAALIPLLERSRIFRDTGFRTPVTQDPVSGRETFHIAAQAAAGSP